MKHLLAIAVIAVAVGWFGTPAQAQMRQAKALTSVVVSSPKATPLSNYQVAFTLDRKDRQGKGGSLSTSQILQFSNGQKGVTVNVTQDKASDGNEYKGYELLRCTAIPPSRKVLQSGGKSDKSIVFDIREGDTLTLFLHYAKEPLPVGTVSKL